MTGACVSKAHGKNDGFKTVRHVYALCAAASAGDIRHTEDTAALEIATGSMNAASQMALRPSRHEIKVEPSGRSLSDLALARLHGFVATPKFPTLPVSSGN
jgi:hypothetical protein